MLVSLSIQNVVLIEKLNIEFQGQLCALTGETGAGKSILLDSLGLALGGRSEARLVRKGAERASVIAQFEVPDNHASTTILKDAGLEAGEGLVLRRTVSADGRSKAYINDQPVSVGLLKSVGDSLIEIHGQFDTQGLLNAVTHRGMLDEYAGIGDALSQLWQRWQAVQAELVALQADSMQAREQEEYLRESIEDLDSLSPEAGEEGKLASLRDQLMSRDQVMDALNGAYQALNGDDDPVRKAWGMVDRVADKLGEVGAPVVRALQAASSEMEEALSAIQSVSDDLQHSEHSLETIDERLFSLRAQARKHGCEVDDLAATRDELARKLNMIEHADDLLAKKIKEVDTLKEAYIEKAEDVRGVRQKSAAKLDRLVQNELPPLKLEKARFVTSVEPLGEDDWGADGMDKVRFLVATNPGAEPGPLGKIASGGEMSRFMLALKVVMAEVGSAESLIFDEVDAGIGGSTADAVGERLAMLATSKQVLVVTHAPQVAARAQHHYIVRKDGEQTVTTNILQLNQDEDRREEIARMLAGASVTDEARAAANKLLETGKAA